MSKQHSVEQQYDLDGNPLSEVDQAMEEVANTSNSELNSSPPVKVLSLEEYRTLRQHASTPSRYSEFSNISSEFSNISSEFSNISSEFSNISSEFSNISLEEKVSARDEL
jgi:hypothetical protein